MAAAESRWRAHLLAHVLLNQISVQVPQVAVAGPRLSFAVSVGSGQPGGHCEVCTACVGMPPAVCLLAGCLVSVSICLPASFTVHTNAHITATASPLSLKLAGARPHPRAAHPLAAS